MKPEQKTLQIKLKDKRLITAKPFLKWAGGKYRLLKQFIKYFPYRFNRYIEPFLGGGAVFFYLWNKYRETKEYLLFDNNEELINTYKIVKNDIEKLIEILKIHHENHNKEYYYKVRNLDTVKLNRTERAARIIYLNKTCFNGLYRVNKTGKFNVPIGTYKNPEIVNSNILYAANTALENAKINTANYNEILNITKESDFIYFDPPYVPLNKTSSFTGYTSKNFGEKDQAELAELFKKLTDKGCICMLSNSYTEKVLNLYGDYRIEIVNAGRAINSNGTGRGIIKEALILNY